MTLREDIEAVDKALCLSLTRCPRPIRPAAPCHCDESREARKSLARIEQTIKALASALGGLLAHEVYTYEGNLEARITVPQDAINAARAALKTLEGFDVD